LIKLKYHGLKDLFSIVLIIILVTLIFGFFLLRKQSSG